MKKKVIALVIDTELTNEQIEESIVHVMCWDKGSDMRKPGVIDQASSHHARNVRVLDSDKLD